jgi:hypothetical protein
MHILAQTFQGLYQRVLLLRSESGDYLPEERTADFELCAELYGTDTKPA